MRNMRQHRRFKLDLLDLSSKMSLVGKVQLIDISLGGVALKADSKLNIGKECLMMLGYEGNMISVKGVVVRSELSGIEERDGGEKATIYSAGIAFKDESAGTVKAFLDSIKNNKASPVPEQTGWFYKDIRFSITTPNERVLNMPAQFGLKEISQSGVIIQTAHQLKVDSMVLLELSLHSSDPVRFMGTVVSCRMPQAREHANYEIGVEFSETTDQDRSLLIRLIECFRAFEDTGEGCGK
jgi:Tfp pilus assembly protein PilZ